MSRELWEQVLVYNVKVGDVIMINTYGHPLTIAEGQIDKYGGIALSGYQIHSHDTVFRRTPDAEDPRVLRRALELAVRHLATLDEELQTEPGAWIAQAKWTLESEAEK